MCTSAMTLRLGKFPSRVAQPATVCPTVNSIKRETLRWFDMSILNFETSQHIQIMNSKQCWWLECILMYIDNKSDFERLSQRSDLTSR